MLHLQRHTASTAIEIWLSVTEITFPPNVSAPETISSRLHTADTATSMNTIKSHHAKQVQAFNALQKSKIDYIKVERKSGSNPRFSWL